MVFGGRRGSSFNEAIEGQQLAGGAFYSVACEWRATSKLGLMPG
jgi:hypothetical protein